jgi:hypothetical protein
MTTECSGKHLEFHPLGQRKVRADFDGGTIMSDGGGLLLREVEKRTAILDRFPGCCTDYRDSERVEYTVKEWWPSGCTGWRWGMRILSLPFASGRGEAGGMSTHRRTVPGRPGQAPAHAPKFRFVFRFV